MESRNVLARSMNELWERFLEGGGDHRKPSPYNYNPQRWQVIPNGEIRSALILSDNEVQLGSADRGVSYTTSDASGGAGEVVTYNIAVSLERGTGISTTTGPRYVSGSFGSPGFPEIFDTIGNG